MRTLIPGAAMLALLLIPGACAHRPPEPAAVTAGCVGVAVASAVGVALEQAVTRRQIPALRIDASTCGELQAVPVDGLARAAVTTALSLARLGVEGVEDPCMASTLATATVWAERVVVALVEALSSGRVVVDVPGELVVCP